MKHKQSIESSRLFARPIKEEDVEFIKVHIFQDSQVMRYLFDGQTKTDEGTLAFIDEMFPRQAQPTGLFPLCLKENGRPIGFCGVIESNDIQRSDGKRDYEFGFALGCDHFGKGYATEIGQAQIDYIFNTLGHDRAVAMTHPENLASIHVLKKLGLTVVQEISKEGRGSRLVFSIEKDR